MKETYVDKNMIAEYKVSNEIETINPIYFIVLSHAKSSATHGFSRISVKMAYVPNLE